MFEEESPFSRFLNLLGGQEGPRQIPVSPEPTVTVWTREDLVERRAVLLAQAGVCRDGISEDVLRLVAAVHALNADGMAIVDEVDRIDHLLGAR